VGQSDAQGTIQLASPKWDFDDATFERSAAAFDNSDHRNSASVSVAINPPLGVTNCIQGYTL
jgi:hypothetical protein